MKNRIIIYLIICILIIPISIYLGFIINSLLLSNNVEIISFLNVMKEFISTKNIRIFSISLQALFMMLFFLLIFLSKYDTSFKTETIKITNNIEIPKASGQGQYGTSRFATDKEFDKKYKKIKLFKKDDYKKVRIKKGGIVVKFKADKEKEEISIVDDNRHSLCLGCTGSGKTRRILVETLCNLGFAGESILVSDPKGELYQMTCKFFEDLGYEVSVIDFKNSEKSNKYNFLQPIIDAVENGNMKRAEDLTWNLVENIVQKNNSSSDPLWENGEKSIVVGSILTIILENRDRKEFQNMTNVYTFISNMCQSDENGFMPLSEYINDLPDDNPAKRIFSISTIAPEKTRSSFFTSALATLRLFTSKNTYTMTNSSDFKLDDMGKKSCIRYIILPDENTTYYELATIFVNQQYQELVNLADSRGGKLEIRNNFILEEFGNFTKIANFESMLTVSRSRNIRFSMFLQSLSQLESKYSKTGAQNIMDNTQVWIYLATASNETAEIISKKLGTYTVSVNSKSSSVGEKSSNFSQSTNLASRNLLTPDELTRFETPYCLIMQSGNFPAKTEIPDLTEWKFNGMLGLGNEESNRQLREKVEKCRKTLVEEPIKIWKIWEDYKY